jgi:plastocyanin
MQFNRLRLFIAALTVTAAACSGEKKAEPTGPPPGALRVDTAKAGGITGQVRFEGTPPANSQAKVASDPACAAANQGGLPFETFMVKDGGFDNVFVYVKDGLGNYYFDVPTEPVKLDQVGCRYTPHVFGARVGQPIEITNSDNTLHNVHALANVNREFNFGQHFKGMKNTEIFTAREIMVPFKCDVHGWMTSFGGILDHPYFAVTANGGKFELKGLPPGTYTIEAWHEKLPAQTQQVTIGEKETKEITFTFKS